MLLKSNNLKFTVFFVTFFLLVGYSNAQFGTNGGDSNEIVIPSDSTSAPIKRGTLKTLKLIFEGKPGKAAMYSLLIPGGGQIYNRKYWKAPIVWAADGVAIYLFIDNRREYRYFRDAYTAKLAGRDVTYRGISNAESLLAFRNDFQLQSERAGIAIVVLHLVSMIEAFTDQHLKNFDIDENLSIDIRNIQLPLGDQAAGLSLIYKF